MAATASSPSTLTIVPNSAKSQSQSQSQSQLPFSRPFRSPPRNLSLSLCNARRRTSRGRGLVCKAADVSLAEASPPSGDGRNWVPVVPLAALPKGERRVIIQDGETILLLWYKDEVFAIENRSPAEGAYSEGLINAKLTKDGCIVCPTTDSTFDLRTGDIKDWYPKNPVLRALTPPLRNLFTYPVKVDGENIYISLGGASISSGGGSAEIVFSGKAQPGVTATDVNVDEVRMVIDEELEGFGFSSKNELINGKAAIIGFLLLLDFELLTGAHILQNAYNCLWLLESTQILWCDPTVLTQRLLAQFRCDQRG